MTYSLPLRSPLRVLWPLPRVLLPLPLLQLPPLPQVLPAAAEAADCSACESNSVVRVALGDGLRRCGRI